MNLAGPFSIDCDSEKLAEELSLQEDDEAQDYLVSHTLEFGRPFSIDCDSEKLAEELSLQDDDEAQEYLVSHTLEFGGTFFN